MKLSFLFVLLTLFLSSAGQLREGLTGVRDSSYSLEKELQKHRKNFPDLQLVKPADTPLVKQEKNILFCITPERILRMDTYRPAKKGRKRTAVIFIHGGGWRSGDKSMHAALLIRLAAQGYVCFSPEYRLSTEALYPAAIHDVKSAIRWVRAHAKQYRVEPDKLVIAGHSAGGELAAFMGSTNGNSSFEGNGCFPAASSKVNAVIDLDGTLAFIHPESGEGDDSKKISAGTYWFGYTKKERPDIWIQAAPLTHAGAHCAPTLFINSSVDRMHAGREDYIKIMDSCDIYTAVHRFENAPHSFCFFEPWFGQTVNYMDQFIKQVFILKKPD